MHNSFLFPGQGSQFIGMGENLYNSYSKIRHIYDIGSEILGFDIAEISFKDNYNMLDQTRFTQPAIFINSFCIDTLLKSKKIYPSVVAGHSLGEFSALVSAGVLQFEDALNIIKIRANEMFNIGNKTPGAMAAIIGAKKEQLEIICNQKDIVVPANINTSEQIVISGEIDSINAAIKTANHLGIKRAIKLKVSGAFHSPLMSSVRKPLSNIINSTNFNNASIPIYQNIDAKPSFDSTIIKKNLIDQLENPVLWMQTILNMKQNGISNFIEVGPGNVLKKLNKKNFPTSKTTNYEELEEVNNYEML